MTLLTLILLTAPAYSQTRDSMCRLTAENAPTVRGLRLGMTPDQLQALFPAGAKRKEIRDAYQKAQATTDIEPVYLTFDPAVDSGKEQFTGVDSVTVGLLNGKVVDFAVLYGGATWGAIDVWVAKLVETFKLPDAQSWTVGPSETPNKVLSCDGIEIEASVQGGSASIRILLKGMRPDRANAAEEKRRREMKP
jgi:hypothetical protein